MRTGLELLSFNSETDSRLMRSLGGLFLEDYLNTTRAEMEEIKKNAQIIQTKSERPLTEAGSLLAKQRVS